MGWHMMVIYPSKTGCWMGLGHHRSGDDQHWIPCLLGNMLCICARTSTCCRSKISRSSFKRSSSQCNNSGPSMARNLMEHWWKPMCNPAPPKKQPTVIVTLDFEWSWDDFGSSIRWIFCCCFAVEPGPDMAWFSAYFELLRLAFMPFYAYATTARTQAYFSLGRRINHC